MSHVYVEVSIPANYHTNISNPTMKMSVHGWYQEDHPEKRWKKSAMGVFLPETQRHFVGGCWIGPSVWLEEASVTGENLGESDELSIIVSTNGASWFASQAYTNHEEATQFAEKQRWTNWHAWAVRIRRLS